VKLATILSGTEKKVVAVEGGKYLDLRSVEPNLAQCLRGILTQSGGIGLARGAAEKAKQAGAYV